MDEFKPGQGGLDKVCSRHLDVAGKEEPYPPFARVSFVSHSGGGDEFLPYLKGCAGQRAGRLVIPIEESGAFGKSI